MNNVHVYMGLLMTRLGLAGAKGDTMTPTQIAIRKIAYCTANQAKGQRQQDAIKHCRQLGINHNAASFCDSIQCKYCLNPPMPDSDICYECDEHPFRQ